MSELKESDQSWRPQKWLKILEGRKTKVTSFGLKLIVWISGAAVFITQGMLMEKPTFKRKTEITFMPPNLKQDQLLHYVPQVYDRAAERDDDRSRVWAEQAKYKRREPEAEPIRPIILGLGGAVPAGSEVMVTLSSGGTNGMVKATLTEPLLSSGEVLLEAGTVLLGIGSSSDERLFIKFTKAIRIDHSTSKIKALAYDKNDRILGVKGKKVSDYAFQLAASSGLIFLGAMADGMRNNYNQNAFTATKPTVHDAALGGVATAADDLGKEQLEKMRNQQSKVEVAHSTEVLVIFDDVKSDGDSGNSF